jgi:hypothetical protein
MAFTVLKHNRPDYDVNLTRFMTSLLQRTWMPINNKTNNHSEHYCSSVMKLQTI